MQLTDTVESATRLAIVEDNFETVEGSPSSWRTIMRDHCAIRGTTAQEK